MATFATLLKKYRTTAKLTQAQLARCIHSVGAAICQYESGKRTPDLATANKLADALSLDDVHRLEFVTAAFTPHDRKRRPHVTLLLKRIIAHLYNEDTPERRDKLLSDLERAATSWERGKSTTTTTAIIPVAGWQSKWLSNNQTACLVHAAMGEAKKCGITEFVLIVADNQATITSAFPLSREKSIKLITQPHDALGLANVIRLAQKEISGKPFALILPDDRAKHSCLARLMEEHEKRQRSVVAVLRIRKAKTINSSGGAVGGVVIDSTPIPRSRGVAQINTLAEKPSSTKDAQFKIAGRYILTADIFTAIGEIEPNPRTTELELTDALQVLANDQQLYQVACSERDIHSITSIRKMLEAEIASLLRFAT